MEIRTVDSDESERVLDELLRPSYRESTEWGEKTLDEEYVAQMDCSRWVDSDDRTLFVAEDDGELVGVVTGGLTEGPPIYDRGLAVNCDGLWIVPEHRREGVASSLLDRLADWASGRGAERLKLSVHAENEAALEFYRERGFQTEYRTLTTDL